MKTAMFGIVAALGIHAATAAPTVWDGVHTAEQAKRGEATYVEHCTSCHKAHLLGDDDYTTPLFGPSFMSKWNNRSVGDLYEKIRTTMPANDPDGLKPQEYVDVLSFLMSANELPTGQAELPPDLSKLKLITWTETRPR